jgi:hypothetical protein
VIQKKLKERGWVWWAVAPVARSALGKDRVQSRGADGSVRLANFQKNTTGLKVLAQETLWHFRCISVGVSHNGQQKKLKENT